MLGRILTDRSAVSVPDSNVAICFDPVEQKLFTAYRNKVEEQDLYTKVKLPRRDSCVRCFVTEKKTNQKIFVGTVNLKKLGYKINRRRKNGEFENIYILGTE